MIHHPNKAFNSITVLIIIVLLVTVAAACGSTISMKQPEEINMADMSGHAGHVQGAGAGSPAVAASCAEMTEAPSNAPVKRFELTAAVTEIELNNGKKVEAWTYNGLTPGPELRVQEGDRVVVKLTNRDVLRGVTIHWHGVVLPCSQDGVAGVTQDAVWPGESFTYEFIAKHSGTYWYHSHQRSSQQAQKGLMGRLIVEPKASAFSYDRDYAVTLQKLEDRHVLTNGRAGGLALDAEPGETVRLRLINAYNRVQWMGVAGAPFRVVSMDGQDLNRPGLLEGQWVGIGGGQRYDLLFTMPASGKVRIYSKQEEKWSVTLGEGVEPEKLAKDAPVFDFTAYGKPKDDGITPDMNFDRTYTLKLGPVNINGNSGHQVPPLIVKEGEWIKVRFEHLVGGDEHPMHLHGHLFKILSKNDKPLTGSPIYADSVMLFEGDVYEIAFKADNPGLWMEHCHNLGHAFVGMTMMVNYEGVTTPYRVGTKSGNLPD
ncbi:multicopper oxidase family protein [Paenibacillus arenilitoris]|uniref:Multicopper oxidase family protein n=1 Tax=Paenibacillus arenilitoris TaxID=2772299 RepID=A0A927CKR8_9BACL|nr:multicopper oxidase family protein [Paenibacillus arenilitoris]MBD2867686.1 multicopper oxidase family protein [Paenibacillus arenilitoris]